MPDYEVELFRREKFSRKKCKKCNRFFWTLSDREICGEPPCSEYSFIDNSPTRKSYNLHEMREFYLSFFEKNNHTRVKRYPIIARWSDDVFFTIASISCFQPWVLNGTIDPPANPLTISQTCVRFNDIDNVGKTGRHLTEFEMMAHHAFNTKDKFVYFKDKTVELCHQMLLELGIPDGRLVYIEAEWSGGGNSGPCFEVVVDGVELATLVFMMYEDTPSGKREMDMQVVDTGYGLERFVWISNGTSNAYEAIFDNVLSRLKGELNIHEDKTILSEYSRIAGIMNVVSGDDIRKLRKAVADRIGINVNDLIRIVSPFENLYTICDHTRALMFMLNDGGIVPSNVKAGYFARLLARRTLRALKFLNLEIPLSEVMSLQIDYFKNDFPELLENRDDILELCDVEEKKYQNTILRGRKIISKLDNELMSKGMKEIPLEELINLYDSQGLTPDIVKESSELEVNTPGDFYKRIAERHEQPEKERCIEEMEIPRVESTRLLYYEDQYKRRFKAKILKKFNNFVILDRTCFYPEGGGQETDLGIIDDLDVIEVQKVGSIVLHRVKGNLEGIKEGQEVDCKIDWERRLQLMQHHTTAHIINGAARIVLGNHAWQTGAHKSENLGRLDITHHSGITPEERKRIEELANKIVKENRQIDIRFMGRSDAEKTYGFRIYQGGAVPGREIRIVNIKDWDVEACGGMHFKSTGEVGNIKIINTKRIQDGVVRIEFMVGRALKRYIEKKRDLIEKTGLSESTSEVELMKIASLFSVEIEQLPRTIERFRREWIKQKEQLKELEKIIHWKYKLSEKYRELPSGDPVESSRKLFEEWKSQQKDIQKLRDELKKVLIEDIKKNFEKSDVVKKIVYNFDVGTLIEIAKTTTPDGSLLILANTDGKRANIVVFSRSGKDAKNIAETLSIKIGGNAKGSKELGIGWGSSENIDRILEESNI